MSEVTKLIESNHALTKKVASLETNNELMMTKLDSLTSKMDQLLSLIGSGQSSNLKTPDNKTNQNKDKELSNKRGETLQMMAKRDRDIPLHDYV